jgi:outer membrane protein assembly factor BamB
MTQTLMRRGLAVTLVAILCGPACAETWPQWRGPDGQGHAPDARDLPVRWSETENVSWKTPLPGRGWSSPVLDAERIWLTSAVEPADTSSRTVHFHALCIARETGRLLHDVRLFTVHDPQPIHALNSHASPSPVLAGGRVFCHFGDYGTACVDAATAAIVWSNRDHRVDHQNGPGSSPIVWRDLLIFHCDGRDSQAIVALDTRTGSQVWKTPRSGALRKEPDFKKSYGTPLVLTVDGRDLLVSPAADWIYGYDPATGREIWRQSYGVQGFSVVPRPVVGHGLLFMSTSFMQPELLALRIGTGTAAPEIVWREKKGAPTMPSPLVVGDEVYMVSEKGVVTCLDARTGAVHWSERLGGNFSSSPLFAGGRIYVGNRDGDTFVVQPGRTFSLEATNRLTGSIMATPAAVGRALYLRTDAALYRIETPRP